MKEEDADGAHVHVQYNRGAYTTMTRISYSQASMCRVTR